MAVDLSVVMDSRNPADVLAKLLRLCTAAPERLNETYLSIRADAVGA